MPYYTQVYLQTSPECIYKLEDGNCILIPSGQVKYDLSDKSFQYFDSIYFYTETNNVIDHIELLKKWIIFHSFIFWDLYPIQLFHNEKFTKHKEIDNFKNIAVNNIKNKYPVDFDNIGNCVYFPNKSKLIIGYNTLYNCCNPEHLESFIAFLDSFPFSPDYRNYSDIYLIFDHSYYEILSCVTLIEKIIGHPDNCEKSIECNCCGKKLQHRKESEKIWRDNFLYNVIEDKNIASEYSEIIEFTIQKIRHRIAHDVFLPSAKYKFQKTSYEEYGFERSKNEYKDNKTALSSLKIGISTITRYLMLFNIFGLKEFYPTPHLKVARFG